MSEHWLIYALGGGMGHLNRALALARATRRWDRDALGGPPCVTLLVNTPLADPRWIREELGTDHRLICLDPQLERDQVAAAVRRVLGERRFDRLIVDTFPRGLGGELADYLPTTDAAKMLVHRDLNPRYIKSYGLEQFVEHYDLVLLPGEQGLLGDSPKAHQTPPWLIRDAGELLSPEAAREELGAEDDRRPLIAVLGCGRQGEVQQMAELANHLRVRLERRADVRLQSLASGGADSSHRPFFALIRGVDLVVGAGGYNSVHEARSGGAPLIAVARKRLYDRQHVRLHPSEQATSLRHAAQRVDEFVSNFSRHTRPAANYVNGVHLALRLISKVETETRVAL